MSISGTSDRKPVQEEIIDLAGTLADAHAKLQQLAERVTNDAGWQKRCEELENSHKEAVNGAKWLRAQNIDLLNKLSNSKPEMNNALTAREDAFRKLKHARKVIRDLLTERGDMSSPRSGKLTQEEIDEALGEGPGPSRSESSSPNSSDNGSDRTVRLHLVNSPSQAEHGGSPGTGSGQSVMSLPRSAAAASSPRSATAASSPRSATAASSPRSAMTASSSRSVTRPYERDPQHPGSPPRSRSSGGSFQSLTEMAARTQSPTESSSSRVQSPEETWWVHFRNPPGVAVLQEGPITWDRLQTSLSLGDDTVKSLHNFVSSPDLSTRLVITQYGKNATVAFLLDPIVVDKPGKSYLLEWGRPRANRNIEQYMSSAKLADPTFHTFFCPLNKHDWFYIGALEWTPIPPPVDIWTTLDDAGKQQVLDQLSKRTNGEVKEAEIANRLASGALEYFWVELTSIGDQRISHDFVTEVLGRQAYSRSSGRRSAGVKE